MRVVVPLYVYMKFINANGFASRENDLSITEIQCTSRQLLRITCAMLVNQKKHIVFTTMCFFD